MVITGHFELDQKQFHLGETLWVTLVIQNESDQAVFLFVARGRDHGLQITVKQGGGAHLQDLSREPEVGLVPEQRLSPHETFRQRYQLSQWLSFTEPGDYTVECAIEVEAYNASLHQDTVNRVATKVLISTDLRFTILPNTVVDDQGLQRFQDAGDVESLLKFVETTGKAPRNYQEAANSMAPIFQAISSGRPPAYDQLDRETLRHRMSEVEEILKWMADSKKAEIKATAIQVMGFLGWESFIPYLSQCLCSGIQWERLAAISALGEIPSERALDALRAVVEDPDPEIRAATGAALFKLSSKL